jgi:putative intracellular protease/amidase
MAKLLMVLTGAGQLVLKDGTRKPTGFWAEEFVVPHERFRAAGVEVDVATPGGVEPPLDRGSLAPEVNAGRPEVVAHYEKYLASLPELNRPLVLEGLGDDRVDGYDGVFLPGGHGPMEDLARSESLGRLVSRLHSGGKLVSAVCHGPAGLLLAGENGSWRFRGYRLTGFTNQEEQQVGLADKVPFLLESRLRELGAMFEAGPAWASHVVTDRNLVTGQNPSSSGETARAVLAWLGA